MKKFLFALLATTALVFNVQAETQTYSSVTDAANFKYRTSGRMTSGTTVVTEGIVTKGNISFIVSSTTQVSLSIVQMLKDGTVISTTSVTPSNTQNIVTIAAPQNFQMFKVSPTTTAGTSLIDIGYTQSWQ